MDQWAELDAWVAKLFPIPTSIEDKRNLWRFELLTLKLIGGIVCFRRNIAQKSDAITMHFVLAIALFTWFLVYRVMQYILAFTSVISFCSTNFLQVKVFFDRLNYQEVQEQLSYKVTIIFIGFLHLTIYWRHLNYLR